jgi:sugar O-acyltransferase (sialic acid O-acetyltransferase NeuD family)
MDKAIIMVGYSGHGFVVAEAAIASKMNLKYYSEQKTVSLNPYDLEYIGYENDPQFNGWQSDLDFILAIGNNAIRHQIAKNIMFKNGTILNVIHPLASISNKVQIGKGNFIARNVAINPLAKIEDYCILNTGCIIEHECAIKTAAHIAPGAVLAGNVTVGERTFIGANSVIKQGVTIGNDVLIGAGSVVINDVPDQSKLVGNPARILSNVVK